MWPFKSRKSKVENKLRQYSDLASEEVRRTLEEDKAGVGVTTLSKRNVHFCLFEFHDDDTERLASNIDHVFHIIQEHGGIVDSMLSPFVLGRFGFVDSERSNEGTLNMSKAAHHAVVDLGRDVKVLYGTRPSLLGTIFADRVIIHGALFANLASCIDTLRKLEFGGHTEI